MTQANEQTAIGTGPGERGVPEGYRTLTPWIISKDTAGLMDYLKAAFGGEELARVPNPDGSIGHAEMRLGDSIVMLFDAKEGWPPTPSFLRLFVEDADAVCMRALAAGGSSVTEVTELFFGDRVGRISDPAGNIWWIQTHVADVSPTEMGKRAGEPKFADAMREVQDSLDRELRRRARNSVSSS